MVPTVGRERGEGGSLYLTATLTVSHHQNDFRIKMGSAVSQFTVFINGAGQSHGDSVHKSQYHEENGEPKRGVEPESFRLAAERLTTRPRRLTTDRSDYPSPVVPVAMHVFSRGPDCPTSMYRIAVKPAQVLSP